MRFDHGLARLCPQPVQADVEDCRAGDINHHISKIKRHRGLHYLDENRSPAALGDQAAIGVIAALEIEVDERDERHIRTPESFFNSQWSGERDGLALAVVSLA
jgi:hypothetical protein